jgi:2-oxoisovalerate dehydrogenase E2 component (dihydrolipoyl transacylase)
MANYVFKLPDVGEGIAEAEIVAWHVEVGDAIKEDQPLVDVMTDKATVEIGSPVTGRVLSRKGETGEKAAVGAELVVIETEAAEKGAGSKKTAMGAGKSVSPAAAAKAAPVAEKVQRSGTKNALAAPAIRARAKALGIDLSAIEGSGPDGRIQHADLDRLLARKQPREEPRPSAAVEARVPEGVEEIRVIGLRRQIAQTMLEAKRRIPHFTYVEEVDVSALESKRRELNDKAKAGEPKLTLLPFLIRAIVQAIPEHPGVNALFDDERAVIQRHRAVHVGVATQTRRGLLVPVIRNAETLGLFDIAREILRLSEAARAGKATREELTGSTITVTSLGALGGVAATPIIKPPEVAIIGVNRMAERPVVRDGSIVIRKMMNLSSSFDHRVVDGFDAASFIQAVKALLEAPENLIAAS